MKPVSRLFAGCEDHIRSFSERPLRIAHISDQHVGKVTPYAFQEHAMSLTEGADMVCLTGDFVAHSLDYLDQLEALMLSLDVPAFAVLGNHDHWADADAVTATLRKAGVEVLNNQNTKITIDGRTLSVVGVDDGVTGNADIAKAVKGLDRSLPSIGLSHLGELSEGLWAHGVSLVLSGHTHAGQISKFKMHKFLAGSIAGHKYVHGLYGDRDESRALYVSAGIGSSVVGLRIGKRATPEVPHFLLGTHRESLDEDFAVTRPMRGRKPRSIRITRNRKKKSKA